MRLQSIHEEGPPPVGNLPRYTYADALGIHDFGAWLVHFERLVRDICKTDKPLIWHRRALLRLPLHLCRAERIQVLHLLEKNPRWLYPNLVDMLTRMWCRPKILHPMGSLAFANPDTSIKVPHYTQLIDDNVCSFIEWLDHFECYVKEACDSTNPDIWHRKALFLLPLHTHPRSGEEAVISTFRKRHSDWSYPQLIESLERCWPELHSAERLVKLIGLEFDPKKENFACFSSRLIVAYIQWKGRNADVLSRELKDFLCAAAYPHVTLAPNDFRREGRPNGPIFPRDIATVVDEKLERMYRSQSANFRKDQVVANGDEHGPTNGVKNGPYARPGEDLRRTIEQRMELPIFKARIKRRGRRGGKKVRRQRQNASGESSHSNGTSENMIKEEPMFAPRQSAPKESPPPSSQAIESAIDKALRSYFETKPSSKDRVMQKVNRRLGT
eukprot:Plantae.Rhodophyta-Hildenbrandia_rubra.ctg19271.p1 GENE.Plantae.Rhodophyta-Hildenbrandia_rubra.ctg19271~~Plantae.Rhodophyta-Hildenbrandia_rubra.ctg19271.p1  ORF type:complete len:442 (+),score=54.46 Plantae.Rhodophyta-Hildenbrandia_rubra.ctg19271:1736-3061(+)